MAKKRPRNKSPQAPTFEEALDTLERIVVELEEGGAGLAESLARYEEGVKLLRHCHDVLEKAQRKIELVTGVDEQGNPVSIPLDDGDQRLQEKAEGPRHRVIRSHYPAPGSSSCTEGTDMDSSGGLS